MVMPVLMRNTAKEKMAAMTAGPMAASAAWVSDVEEDLRARKPVDLWGYETLRGHARASA